MGQSPAELLANVPGWDGASFERLTGGLTNDVYHVRVGGKSAVLKVDQGPRQSPFNTRLAEAQIQAGAAEVGLAASVIAADEQMYLTEYLEGDVWTPTTLQDEHSLSLLGSSLRKLHSLPLTGRCFDAAAAASQYAQGIEVLDNSVVALCLQQFAGIRMPRNLRCCHNDLVAENIISTPELMFLDWEYACDNDPLFDLATVVEHHNLSDTQSKQLLDAYFDSDGSRWLENLVTYRRMYVALLCLWMASQPGCDSDELDRVVTRITTNYS